MKEKVKILRLQVTRQGQWVFFQIRLPSDALAITGIETGIAVQSNLGTLEPLGGPVGWINMKRSKKIGELRLESLDEAGFFYAGDVVEADRNLSWGDFSFQYYKTIVLFPGTTAEQVVFDYSRPPDLFWSPELFSHGFNRYEDPFELKAQKLICGYYRDTIGESLEQDTAYTLSIYTWYRTQ